MPNKFSSRLVDVSNSQCDSGHTSSSSPSLFMSTCIFENRAYAIEKVRFPGHEGTD